MSGIRSGIKAVAHGLAINGDELRGELPVRGLDKSHETAVEPFGIYGREHSAERVIARGAVGEFEEFAQPGLLEFGEARHIIEAFALADDGSESHEDDLAKVVSFVTAFARIRQLTKRLNAFGKPTGKLLRPCFV